jgi:hypothetical protein
MQAAFRAWLSVHGNHKYSKANRSKGISAACMQARVTQGLGKQPAALESPVQNMLAATI